MILLRTAFTRYFKVGFGMAMLVLALVFYFAYQKIQLLSETSNLVTHTQGVRLELSQLNDHLQEATSLHRKFLTIKDSAFLQMLDVQQAEIYLALHRLDSLTSDSPVQQRNLDSLQYLLEADLKTMRKVTWEDVRQMTPIWTDNRALMDSVQLHLRRMDRTEATLLTNREITRDQSMRTAPLFALLLLLLALIILIFSYLRIRNDLRRSRRQMEINLENTQRIVQLNETLQHAEQIAHTGNWQTDLHTGQRRYSDNIYRLFGYEPHSFTPELNNWLPLVHPDDQPLVSDFVEASRNQKTEPGSIIFRLTRPDGQLRYFRAGGKILPGDAGGQLLIGTVQDITEAHQLRRDLEERTHFAELVVESSIDMIAAYDQDLHYTIWNQRCADVMAMSKEAVLGKHIFDVFPSMQGQEIIQSLHLALAGQPSYLPPRFSLISDNYFESYVLPLNNDAGVINGVLTITHDVTESFRLRQALEERSRFAETIIESSIDIIVTYDTELRITAWNRKSEEVFQLRKEEVIGRHVTEVFPNLVGSPRLADLQRVLAGETVQYEPEELSLYGIHANLYLLPLKDHTGRVTGVLSISHDVTDSVRAAGQLAQLNRSLEEKNMELANTNAELASFSYVASHDLQEPLRKIQAFGSRILTTENERLSEVGKEAFRRMQSAADRMQQLIEDLLSYSRTNTQPGEFATEDLNVILQEAETELSETIQEKRARIEADTLPQARVVAFQFRQLLVNLLSNALKYQRAEEQPFIWITCATVPGVQVPVTGVLAKSYYCIAIQDNGIGFEQQYAERIFELFQRLHGRSEYKGTGIGLAICRKIMQNHHGYLFAEGRPGEGATFTIYLPV